MLDERSSRRLDMEALIVLPRAARPRVISCGAAACDLGSEYVPSTWTCALPWVLSRRWPCKQLGTDLLRCRPAFSTVFGEGLRIVAASSTSHSVRTEYNRWRSSLLF